MGNLNPEQRKAVEHGEGPLLVVAGPGSGKTSVITQRVVHLLESVPALLPENILALTFTDKAAGEMKSRVGRLLPGLDTAPHISTFHSFCYGVLRQRHFERQLLDKIDIWIFLRRRMEQLGLEYYQKLAAPGAFLHDLNNFFSQCQDELVGPEEFEAYVRKLEAEWQARAPGLDPATSSGEDQYGGHEGHRGQKRHRDRDRNRRPHRRKHFQFGEDHRGECDGDGGRRRGDHFADRHQGVLDRLV